MIYEHYFQLSQRPFSIAPNPNFLYASGQYQEALAALEYGMLHRGGFVLLTGEVGTGKTTLCKFLLQSVPNDTEVALILHPQLDRLELLQLICKEFGIATENDQRESQLIEALTEFLLSVYSKGGYSVLIIDEAQHLDPAVLELIRLLTNLETHEDKLLQIILLGQPELKARLERYDLRQLNQRFTARYHLNGLSFSETKSYLQHRLDVAGGHRSLFSLSATWLLYKLTSGIPRLINVLADRCLMGCYAEQKQQVSGIMVWKASKEVMSSTAKSFNKMKWIGISVFLLAGLSLWLLNSGAFQMHHLLDKNSAILNEYVNSNNAKQKNDESNPCENQVECWQGALPVSVISKSGFDGRIYLNGRWQEFSGQGISHLSSVPVAIRQVSPELFNGLVKPFEKSEIVPWVRSVLSTQGNLQLANEDVSQWQVISPEGSITPPSDVYDVVLHDQVMSFQRRHGLLVDGILGPQTLISLSLWNEKMQMVAQ